MPSSTGFFKSEQIELVQRVFKAILRNPLFERTHENEQALAAFVVRCLQEGLDEEDRLLRLVETAARTKWAKPIAPLLPPKNDDDD